MTEKPEAVQAVRPVAKGKPIKVSLKPPKTPMTPMDMIGQAVERDAGVEVIAKLMELEERWRANLALQSFDAAISAARKELPAVIRKNRTVSFGQGKTSYEHEDLGEIKKTVDPILSKHGLDYRWRSHQEGTTLFLTCVLSHNDGHREETTLSAPNDTSGSKNPLQSVGSAATYLQRYTLKLALGLAAAKDTDARDVSQSNDPISEDQLAKLNALADELGIDKRKFCEVYGYADMPSIQAKDFDEAKKAMEKKRKKVTA